MTYLSSDDSSDTIQKLLNMMRISNEYSYDHTYALKYIQNSDICNRNSAVCWMKYVSLQYFIDLTTGITYS